MDSGDHDIMLEAAILKVFASEASWEILYDTMQIYGGRSFFTDQPFERLMRDARLNMIGEGSNDVLQVFIAVVGLRDVGLNLKEMMQLSSGFFANIKKMVTRFMKPEVPVRSHDLRPEAKKLVSATQRFGMAVIKTLAKYKEDVVDQQLVCDRLATAVTSLYTSLAVISQCDLELQMGNRKNLSTAKLYCQLAFDKYDHALKTLSNNWDEDYAAVADEVSQQIHE